MSVCERRKMLEEVFIDEMVFSSKIEKKSFGGSNGNITVAGLGAAMLMLSLQQTDLKKNK